MTPPFEDAVRARSAERDRDYAHATTLLPDVQPFGWDALDDFEETS